MFKGWLTVTIFLELVVPVAAIIVPVEANEAPVNNVVIPAEATVVPVNNSTTTSTQPGYFALLLEQLKNFFVTDKTNSTIAEPSASVVEQVVLA